MHAEAEMVSYVCTCTAQGIEELIVLFECTPYILKRVNACSKTRGFLNFVILLLFFSLDGKLFRAFRRIHSSIVLFFFQCMHYIFTLYRIKVQNRH